MKAGIIKVAGTSPVYGDFNEPVAGEGQELITVSAAALSQFSKSRSSGSRYSSSGTFPSVAGADGVGQTADGRHVYFVLPEAPYGALAERTRIRFSSALLFRTASMTLLRPLSPIPACPLGPLW
jgi:hypothetical protein